MKRQIPLWVGLVIIVIIAAVAGLVIYKSYESYANTAESLGYEPPPLTNILTNPKVFSGDVAVPTVNAINFFSGPAGTSITITGSGFASTGNMVEFSGLEAAKDVNSPDGTTLTFTVPSVLYALCFASSPRCPEPITPIPTQTYDVAVNSDSQLSNSIPFTVTAVGTSAITSGYYTQTSSLSVDESNSGQPPLGVSFSVAMPYGQTFSVSFGDGGTSGPLTLEQPHGGGPAAGLGIAGHIYTQDGVYIAKLLDALGNTLAIEPITVSGPTQSGIIDPRSLISKTGTPTISGSASNVNFVEVGIVNNVSASDVYDGSAAVVDGRWTVTDTSTILDNGNYEIGVDAEEKGQGLTNLLATGTLTIASPTKLPPANFSANPTSGPAPLTVTFSANRSITQGSIDFGDYESGDFFGGATTIYQCPGTYIATLQDASGNTVGTTTITVTNNPHETVQCVTRPPVPGNPT